MKLHLNQWIDAPSHKSNTQFVSAKGTNKINIGDKTKGWWDLPSIANQPESRVWTSLVADVERIWRQINQASEGPNDVDFFPGFLLVHPGRQDQCFGQCAA